ncbi:MAG: adenosylmethionine--8-amino-7-oxononanoate transaminase [Spirochaetes bacterium]|nr:adenosylmethionine--8-amino-7-oxononanoate transaminase [Spirochaetota bacterium]
MNSRVWHPFTPVRARREPLPVRRAKGARLTLAAGRVLIDGISSWWVNLHGHAHPSLARAIAAQARKLEQVIFAGFTHEPAETLADRLCRILPGPMERVFFSDDGSTSVEVAIKIALQYWHNQGRPRRSLVALDGAYHGDTFGAMSAGARGIFSAPFDRHLFRVERLPFPSPDKLAAALAKFRRLLAGDRIAAFIYEPLVQGSAGMRMYPPASLAALLELARTAGVPCIADEVMTGFGRTGTLFASQQVRPQPDLVCLSKGLTGGFLPMGLTAVSRRIFRAFDSAEPDRAFWHGHSYTANPLACAAALASLDLLLAKESLEDRRRVAATFAGWARKLSAHPAASNPRHHGCIFAFEVRASRGGYLSPVRDCLEKAFLERGVLLRPLGNTVYVLPPYAITDGELGRIWRAIEAVLSEI